MVRSNCNMRTCEVSTSYYPYRPDLVANGFFLFLFCFCLAVLLLRTSLSRAFLGFNIALLCGIILEIIGYSCRVIGSQKLPLEVCRAVVDFFKNSLETGKMEQSPYAAQYVCLTIAPAFIAAGIYFCISRIVLTYGEGHSRLKPKQYPRSFISCDVASILLQAGGGAAATGASRHGKSPEIGNDIVLAGLSFQVITMRCSPSSPATMPGVSVGMCFSIPLTRPLSPEMIDCCLHSASEFSLSHWLEQLC